MKNKKTLYVLIPMVALIWGLIIWRVLSFRGDSDQHAFAADYVVTELVVDTSHYALLLNYRDPFLRAASGSSGTRVKEKIKSNNIRKVNMPSVRGPQKPDDISYKGIIRCGDELVALLELNGEKKLVREQSTIHNYQILELSRDSLRIRYMEKEFVYGKE